MFFQYFLKADYFLLLNEQTIREMLTKIGVDYDKASFEAEGLTDSEIIEMLRV